MRVVPLAGLVFDVRGVDGDAARLFLRRRVNLVVRLGFASELGRQHRGDGRRQRGLAMVHVPYRPHVHVRLRTFKFAFCHCSISVAKSVVSWMFKVSAHRRAADRHAPGREDRNRYFVRALMIASATFFGASA
jgi:hypothetical protein